MTSYAAQSSPHFSGLIVPVPSQNDSIRGQSAADQWLLSANPNDPNGVYFDVEAPVEPAITKHEQHSELMPNITTHKEEIDVDLVDIKDPVDLVELHPSQDLMSIVLGSDLKRPDFDIRLDDDIYIQANKQLEANIFPNRDNSIVPPGFPSEDSQTYEWRGDLGLLDRLSYRNLREIPRNWKMTTMDAARIESKLRNPVLSLPWQQENSTSGRLLQAEENSVPPKRIVEAPHILDDFRLTDISVSSANLIRKRTRVDKKKRERGNNKYGRKGIIRCAKCRSRKIKCVFTSEDLPCEFCRDRGFSSCVKISCQEYSQAFNGERLQTYYWMTQTYHSIQSANTVLESPLKALFRHFNPLSDTALRWAVTAWAARTMAPSAYPNRFTICVLETICCLNYGVYAQRTCKDYVFASNLIAWISYSSCLDEVDPRLNFLHSLGFLNMLLDKPKPLEEVLVVFGPFIIDCTNAWTIRNGVIPCRNTTFRQRMGYFDHLRLTDNSGSWYTGVLEAANATLGILLEVSLTCACQTVRREIERDLTRDSVENALQYIRAELGDVDLHQALRTLNQSFQGPQTNHTTVEGQFITRIFHRLRCVLLLQTVLEASSIEFGVLTPKARCVGERVIYFCQKQAIRRDDPIEDYFLTSWHNFSHLLLGGMCISPHDSPDLCHWVIDELEFIGKEECARCLENYWKELDVNVLSEILDYARFPDQWDHELANVS